MRQPRQLEALLAAHPGEWVGIETMSAYAGQQSARTRMSELVKLHGAAHKPLPDGTWRYERRYRVRHAGTDRAYSGTDWRDMTEPRLF